MNISDLFRLNRADFAKGAVTAVFSAIVAVLWAASQKEGFDVFAIDWHTVINAAVYGFVGYLGKNFLSDSQGKVLGKIG